MLQAPEGGKSGQKTHKGIELSRNQKVSSFFSGSQLLCPVTETVLSAKLARRLKVTHASENSKQRPPGQQGPHATGGGRHKAGAKVEKSGDPDGSPPSHTLVHLFKNHMCQIGSAPSLSLCTSFLVTIPSLLLFTIMLGICHQIELGLCWDSVCFRQVA